MSMLRNTYISEERLSQFPFYKTALESSTSAGDWLTLKDKFVDSN
jgi:hypothetical protein